MFISLKKVLISYCFFIIGLQLQGIELESNVYVNNFHINDDNKILSSDYDVEFDTIYTQEISKELFLKSGISKSQISDYSIFTDFNIKRDYLSFNIGIFTSFLNDSSNVLTPGLDYGIGLLIPGIFLLELDMNNSIPNNLSLESGVTINNYSLKAGFYINNAIISGNISSLTKNSGTILNTTSLINNKYFLNIELFDKYTKYRISSDLGWYYLNKKITTLTSSSDVLEGNTSTDIKAGSLFFNTNFTIFIKENINLDLGLLLHLIKFPISEVDTIETDELNWGITSGIKIDL